MEAVDHQVLYGRRGTGKTHAVRYLESEVLGQGDVAAYIDLRTVGSPEGLLMSDAVDPTQRAARLLVDLMGQLHDSLLEAALLNDELVEDSGFVARLDALGDAVTTVRVEGEVDRKSVV